MAGDGESVDVGVCNGTGSSLSVEDHREQGSPLSCVEATGHTPGSRVDAWLSGPIPVNILSIIWSKILEFFVHTCQIVV